MGWAGVAAKGRLSGAIICEPVSKGVSVCVSMSGWMGVSMCALGDHIRVGISGGSVGRCHLVGCAGQYVSMATWRFGWEAVCLEWGLGSGGFCPGGIV